MHVRGGYADDFEEEVAIAKTVGQAVDGGQDNLGYVVSACSQHEHYVKKNKAMLSHRVVHGHLVRIRGISVVLLLTRRCLFLGPCVRVRANRCEETDGDSHESTN